MNTPEAGGVTAGHVWIGVVFELEVETYSMHALEGLVVVKTRDDRPTTSHAEAIISHTSVPIPSVQQWG